MAVSTTPLATGLGPLETIVDVHWGSLPVYVSVGVTANRTGLGSGTPHVATVTLTDAAIDRGCSIVLNTGGTFGSPSNAYFKLVVIKCPGLVTKGNLFSLRLTGTEQQVDFDPPEYLCGHFEDTLTFTDLGQFDGGVDLFGKHVIMHRFRYHREVTNPEGTTVLDYFVDVPQQPLTDAGAIVPPGYPPPGTYTLGSGDFLYYLDGSHIVFTTLPCDSPPPTGKIDIYPFDQVEVVINPQKNHVVIDPGVAFFFDPAQAVKQIGAGDYEGQRTSIWDMFLTNHLGAGSAIGVGDGTIFFKMQKALFALSRPEKIIEVYPTTAVSGLRYNSFGPGFRLNNFVKFPPPTNPYRDNWVGTLAGGFDDGIPLFAGSPPPPVSYIPYNFPY